MGSEIVLTGSDEISGGTVDAQALRGEKPSAGGADEEGYVGAGLDETPAEIATDGSSAENEYAHR